jgi:hypothetical protein
VVGAKVNDRRSAAEDEGQRPSVPAGEHGDDFAETNVWPSENEEAAFLAEARDRGEKVVPVARDVVEEAEESQQPLPSLDEMVNRIPAETRELLDELFRARFVAVRRVKKADLKK